MENMYIDPLMAPAVRGSSYAPPATLLNTATVPVNRRLVIVAEAHQRAGDAYRGLDDAQVDGVGDAEQRTRTRDPGAPWHRVTP